MLYKSLSVSGLVFHRQTQISYISSPAVYMYNHVGCSTPIPHSSPLSNLSCLHRLEVVGLLDLGLALLAHRLPELLALLGRVEVVLDIAALGSGQVDRLLLQGHLGRERVGVSRGQGQGFGGQLALGGELSLLLRFRWEQGVSTCWALLD